MKYGKIVSLLCAAGIMLTCALPASVTAFADNTDVWENDDYAWTDENYPPETEDDAFETEEEPEENYETFGDFKYRLLKNGTVEIMGYTGSDAVVTIPSEINGKTVTSIGDVSFVECLSMTEVIIPDTVTNIGFHTFSWCYNLKKAVLPNSITIID